VVVSLCVEGGTLSCSSLSKGPPGSFFSFLQFLHFVLSVFPGVGNFDDVVFLFLLSEKLVPFDGPAGSGPAGLRPVSP